MASSSLGCEGPSHAERALGWAGLDSLEASTELDSELKQKSCQMD